MLVVKCYYYEKFIGYLTRFNKSCILSVSLDLEKAMSFIDFDFFIFEIYPCLPKNHFTYFVDEYDICNLTGVRFNV